MRNPCLDCRIENAATAMRKNAVWEKGEIVRYAPIGQQAMVVHMDNPKARVKSRPCPRHEAKAEHGADSRMQGNPVEHGGVWDGLSERELFLRRRAK